MAEKRRKIVNIVFVSLIIATLVLGMLFCLWAFVEDRDNNDAKIIYALAVIVFPVLAFFVFSSEVFLWRSIVFLVSYPGHRKIELAANILLAAASVVSLGYTIYDFFEDTKIFIQLYALLVQFLCQCMIWIARFVTSRKQSTSV